MRTHHPRIPAILGAGAIALTGLTIAPTAQAAKTADGLMDVVITQAADANGGVYAVGSTLTFDIKVTNLSAEARSFEVAKTNLGGRVTACKWRNIAAKATKTDCMGYATHTITQADLDAGSFTPEISYTVRAPEYKGDALNTPETVRGAAVPIKAAPPGQDAPKGPQEPEEEKGDFPKAEPAPLPDASVSLPASMSDGTAVATGTATDNVRIPAITTAPNGDLLVAYDVRPTDNGNKGGDSPNPNHIVQRRSTDGGKTWGAPTYIHKGIETGAKEGYSDPSYVVDSATGAIFNFHVKSFDAGWPTSRAGSDPADRGVIQAEVSTSTDNGHTWTHRVITPDITNDPSWIARFAASGQGIQIQNGEHKGRLVQQFTIKLANGTIRAVSVYSDDHGATWKAGTPAGTGMDENKVVELSDGRLMMNSRVSDGSGFRKVATSTDGGQTWSEPVSDKNLPDSVDNAQIIRAFPNAAPGTERAKVLLLSHSPNPKAWSRDRGTISLSCDDGATWTGKVFRAERVGYTTLAVQSDGSLGVLSEDGNDRQIAYRNFSLAWLGSDCPALKDAPSPEPKPEEPPAPAPKAGWEKDGGNWRYRNADGGLATGWLKDGASWYYLRSDGTMATGWVKDGGAWYALKDDGAMRTGWFKDGGAWYLLRDNGAMATGWAKDGGKWYHFADSGAMTTGWIRLAGTWYHLGASGAMTTGWLQDGGSWYYLRANGAMATGWVTVGPSRYYMDPSTGVWRG
ncbi:exo-alpha-sialidase [Actinomyces sp. Chiba101]|uniref:sialidase family protein n=1 Tax=Actinomyces TaxID=1654 RepID=UPI000974F3C5|nr:MULTISPECIES: sialidase family protein [Actinomyces]BAW92205.1 exo-alpha-sialidase [Actinomyces sp. Chiba101]GAV94856.1 hypothetical protein ADENT20671_1630 [Actinomyces denticolens]SUU10625.1 Sialidase precursor [Actinomyces denticolens]